MASGHAFWTHYGMGLTYTLLLPHWPKYSKFCRHQVKSVTDVVYACICTYMCTYFTIALLTDRIPV